MPNTYNTHKIPRIRRIISGPTNAANTQSTYNTIAAFIMSIQFID